MVGGIKLPFLVWTHHKNLEYHTGQMVIILHPVEVHALLSHCVLQWRA